MKNLLLIGVCCFFVILFGQTVQHNIVFKYDQAKSEIVKLEQQNMESKLEIESLRNKINNTSIIYSELNDTQFKETQADLVENQTNLSENEPQIKLLTKKPSIGRESEVSSYLNTEDLLFWLVVRFDHAWIKYINAGESEIFNYCIKDSSIYNVAVNYKKSHTKLKQRMLDIRSEGANINGNEAKIYVNEIVEETSSNGVVEEKKYNWVYSAVKRNNIWYLTEMKKATK